MHSSLQSLAHRAPSGATRTRIRWQPYTAVSQSTTTPSSSRSPQTTYLGTPSSVSSPTPQSTPAISYDQERPKHASLPSTATQSCKENTSSKHKFAVGLVDQATKALSEIWRPQDIPTVFLTSNRATISSPYATEPIISHPSASFLSKSHRNTQLPSPVSPNTQQSPASHGPAEQDFGTMFNGTSIVPIRGFVHEVLRRSRTSGCVLQTALCYLEAIRSRVPELAEKERQGQGVMGEPDLSSRIVPGSAADFEQVYECDTSSEDVTSTVRLCDAPTIATELIPNGDTLKKPKGPSPPLTALPPLPSPLLCPRRAFLASLILASKFTQDKCYSNRAWAKLSGLPSREIGRCERALGDALDWRLWVGKCSSAQSSCVDAPLPVARSLSRCQSESDLRGSPSTAFLQFNTSTPNVTRPSMGGLRRSSTLPADAFAQPLSVQPSQTGLDQPMSTPYAIPPIIVNKYLVPSDSDIECLPTDILTRTPSEQASSPTPSTPGLMYSPSSTESSSGDQTIQISSFIDSNMSSSDYNSISSNGMNAWSWVEDQVSQKSYPSSALPFDPVGELPVMYHSYTSHTPAANHTHLGIGSWNGDFGLVRGVVE